MEFVYTAPQNEIEKLFGGFFHVNASGPIEIGDADKFKRFIERSEVPPRTCVYINSGGGNVEEAIEIGRTIREGWLSTDVGQRILDFFVPAEFIVPRKLLPGKCMSAATLVYLGGRLRFLQDGAKFGVHQFSFKNPSPSDISRSQRLSARIARYISDMGICPSFFELSTEAEGHEMKIVSKGDLERLGIVTGGETKVEWTTHARGGGIYVRGERDNIYGHHKIILTYERSSGLQILAMIEAQGRTEELIKFGVVEIVIGEDERLIDVSNRCERKANGIYVGISAKITMDEAQVLANSKSFGLRVRATKQADMFLGVSPMETSGGEDMLRTIVSLGSHKNF